MSRYIKITEFGEGNRWKFKYEGENHSYTKKTKNNVIFYIYYLGLSTVATTKITFFDNWNSSTKKENCIFTLLGSIRKQTTECHFSWLFRIWRNLKRQRLKCCSFPDIPVSFLYYSVCALGQFIMLLSQQA